ncbi:hypothetical protein, partial [Streptomyces sp. NPDC002550]
VVHDPRLVPHTSRTAESSYWSRQTSTPHQDRVRALWALDNLPSASWEVNRGWMLAANLATDFDT